jgi:hypothetical protein
MSSAVLTVSIPEDMRAHLRMMSIRDQTKLSSVAQTVLRAGLDQLGERSKEDLPNKGK